MQKAIRTALLMTAFFAVLLCLVGCGSDNAQTQSAISDMHEHVFAPADCENPQKCPCGATRGNPVGHSWINATCTSPKTCLACERTEGEPLPHDFVEGVCMNCDAYDPDSAVDSPSVWISKDGRYHGNATCGTAPNEEPIRTSLTKARMNGNKPCPRCYVAHSTN